MDRRSVIKNAGIAGILAAGAAPAVRDRDQHPQHHRAPRRSRRIGDRAFFGWALAIAHDCYHGSTLIRKLRS